MSQASRAATTHVHTFGLILEERVRDGSPEFRVRLVAGTSFLFGFLIWKLCRHKQGKH